MGRLTALVSELAVSVVLGVAAGAWVDGYLSTTPIFTLLLTLSGLTLGLVRLSTSLKADSDDDADPPPDRP